MDKLPIVYKNSFEFVMVTNLLYVQVAPDRINDCMVLLRMGR